MSLKNYFYYDEENCEFIPIVYNSLERIVYTACVWILCGVVLAGIGISLMASTAGTPSEIALKAENKELHKQLLTTSEKIQLLDHELDEMARVDNEMYRSVLGMEPIAYEEREGGTGGADIYSDFDAYSEETAEILRRTTESLESLEHGINIQKSSFDEIKRYYNDNQKKMKHVPAIKPAKGILLSGFGNRYHPVLEVRRMHEGIDFRANVGEEVYATGDGVVKYASRKGTYGLLVVIDHGFGYETRYAHLSSFADGIRSGTEVKRGDTIGKAGESGLTEGPHLHYEVLQDGRPVDPLNYLFADTSPQEYLKFKEIAETNEKSMD